MKKTLMTASLIVLVVLMAGYAFAETLPVSGPVSSSCYISSMTGVTFPPYIPGQATPNFGQGNITVICTAGTPYAITMDAGNSGNCASREMRVGGADPLTYNLYTDPGYLNIWCTPGYWGGGGVGTGLPQSYTIYGKENASQSPSASTHTDFVTVTLTI